MAVSPLRAASTHDVDERARQRDRADVAARADHEHVVPGGASADWPVPDRLVFGITSMVRLFVPGITCGTIRSWKPMSTGEPWASVSKDKPPACPCSLFGLGIAHRLTDENRAFVAVEHDQLWAPGSRPTWCRVAASSAWLRTRGERVAPKTVSGTTRLPSACVGSITGALWPSVLTEPRWSSQSPPLMPKGKGWDLPAGDGHLRTGVAVVDAQVEQVAVDGRDEL